MEWELLFYPKGFVAEHEIGSLDQFRLTAEMMQKLGNITTRLRADIKQRALEMINGLPGAQRSELDEICRLRVRKRMEDCDSQLAAQRSSMLRIGREPTSTWKRRKRKLRRLALEDKVEALHMVLVNKESQATVARHFRVTAPTISRLVRTALKNPRVLSELVSKRTEVQQQKAEIRGWLEEILRHNVFLDSVGSVTKTLNEVNAARAKPELVRQVMAQDMGMRFRKVKALSKLENSTKNLVLRQ